MVAGQLRAVVCTGSLDLGIDWGDVDLVIQVGAPKNVKRLVQRIGRANHRYNAPSKALLVPANRFEVVECKAALDAVRARDLDGDPARPRPARRAVPAYPDLGLRRPVRRRCPVMPRSPPPAPMPT
jgi:ATP-dependent Lhr-like helicase